jgi:hypothetical protein
VNLQGQRLYYDELHQATASFAYTGTPGPHLFEKMTIRGIPVLNMPYSGAIKTALYGLYMRSTSLPFTVISWRLTGILVVCLAIAGFCILAGRARLFVAIITLGLLLADPTIVLTTRHDWGPTAFALALRLLFIGLVIRGTQINDLSKNSFFLGMIVGVSIFEKLSSVVLFIPLSAVMSIRRTKTNTVSAVLGLLIGLLPLIACNLYSLVHTQKVIFLTGAVAGRSYSWHGFRAFFMKYVSLGSGAEVANFILGTRQYGHSAETWILCTVLFLIVAVNLFYRRKHIFFDLSQGMVCSYLGIAFALYLLPQITWVHHWIIGTPFQYTAIAFCTCGIYLSRTSRWRKPLGCLVLLALSVLFIFRLGSVISLETALTKRYLFCDVGHFSFKDRQFCS